MGRPTGRECRTGWSVEDGREGKEVGKWGERKSKRRERENIRRDKRREGYGRVRAYVFGKEYETRKVENAHTHTCASAYVRARVCVFYKDWMAVCIFDWDVV